MGGATVADVCRAGERNGRRRQAVGRRVKGVGDANLHDCWAKGDGEALVSMEREREKGAGERSRGPERLLRSDGESIFPEWVSISQVQSSISVPGPFILRAPGTLKHLGVENRCRERSPIPRLYYCYYFTNYYYYYGLIPSSMWLWFVFWLARPEYACYLQGFA